MRWVIIWPAPPPQTLATNHPYYRAVFRINIFEFFCKKTLTFWIYPTTSCFIKIVQKVNLALVIPFCSIFWINHKVVPLVFFRFWWKVRQSRFRDFNIFVIFSEKLKSFEFTTLRLILLELLKKWFYKLKSHFVSFFMKKRVVTYLTLFSDFEYW